MLQLHLSHSNLTLNCTVPDPSHFLFISTLTALLILQPQTRNIAQLFLSSFNHTFNIDEIEAFLSE